jgi:hypothetical protein
VLTQANIANLSAANDEPPLKPYHPNHNNPVPKKVKSNLLSSF